MRRHLLLPMTLATALLAVAACGDEVTDPEDLLESAEAEAVMRSAEALPLLPELMDAAAVENDRERAILLRARELWDAGSAADDARGAARRRLAIGYAVPVLLETVPHDQWVEARERTDQWVATANAMLRHLTLPEVAARLESAEGHLRRADATRSERARLQYLLLAGSELVETTPRFVARVMAERAGVAVEAASAADPPLHEAALRRAERLRDWAVQAVQDGEYLVAIQRAYYAVQLTEAQ